MLSRKIYRFLLTIPIYFFIPIILGIDISINFISAQFIDVDTKDISFFMAEMGIWGSFLFAIVITPLFETIFFQWLVIDGAKYVFSKVKMKHYVFPMLVSASFFGLNHYYSLSYIIVTFFSGCIYAFSFILVRKRQENPMIVISIIHALFNLIPFYQDFFSK